MKITSRFGRNFTDQEQRSVVVLKYFSLVIIRFIVTEKETDPHDGALKLLLSLQVFSVYGKRSFEPTLNFRL